VPTAIGVLAGLANSLQRSLSQCARPIRAFYGIAEERLDVLLRDAVRLEFLHFPREPFYSRPRTNFSRTPVDSRVLILLLIYEHPGKPL
jgi:hypothetical protein